MNLPPDPRSRDEIYWSALEELVSRSGYRLRHILQNWPAYVQRQDYPRFLSHYELFRKIIDLPGCVIDLGVYRGATFFTWAALLETFCPFDVSRRVYGFESFQGLQQFSPEDGPLAPKLGKYRGAFRASEQEVQTLMELHSTEDSVPGSGRSQLIVGDLSETLPRFLSENPGLKISLIHFDLDLYAPTKLALELLYPHVVNGGIVCFDEYGLVPWQGETQAVDEYFASRGESPRLEKHSFTQSPHAFWIKQAKNQ